LPLRLARFFAAPTGKTSITMPRRLRRCGERRRRVTAAAAATPSHAQACRTSPFDQVNGQQAA
jgi:hypothetical protein